MSRSPVRAVRNWFHNMLRLRGAYVETFKRNPFGDRVLADLSKFAQVGKSPMAVSPVTRMHDPMATGIMIGRQEVLQRIMRYIEMTDAQLMKIQGEIKDE